MTPKTTPNQKKLKKLVDANDPRLCKIAPSTLRAHVDGRAPRNLRHLARYEELGMPVKGWMTAKELKDEGLRPLVTT
jgi:hypothetical protein